MSKQYGDLFQTSHDAAVGAAKIIEKDFCNFDTRTDCATIKLKFSAMIMQTICKEIAGTSTAKHYDVYYDVMERIFLPHLVPAASPKHWRFFVDCTRYFHYLMVENKQFAIASRICAVIVRQPDKLQSPGDYKPLLGLYGQHLLTQRGCASNGQNGDEVTSMLDAMRQLFVEMERRNFGDKQLISDFVQSLAGQWSARTCDFLASLPADQASEMFKAFFKTLAAYLPPSATPMEPVAEHFRRQLGALVVFQQIDLNGKLRPQLVIQLLRACRDSRHLQSDKAIGCICSLLYYFVRLLYLQTHINNFAATYAELCHKISSFLVKKSAALMHDQWFMDAMTALSLLFHHAHQQQSAPLFSNYWADMANVQCFAVHFQLIALCVRLAKRITDSRLAMWPCCGSVSNHVQMMFVFSALSAYVKLLALTSTTEAEQQVSDSPQLLDELHANVLAIVRQGAHVLAAMRCANNPKSQDIMAFYYYFTQISRASTTPRQARQCVALGEQLVPLRTKFAASDWIELLRRICRTATVITDCPQIGAELLSCYVTTLLQEAPQRLDWMNLRAQIGAYYAGGRTQSQTQPPSCCLLELHQRSQSALKAPPLTRLQRCCLYGLEVQYVKYQRTNGALQASLLANYPGDYAAVLVARASKLQGVAPNTGERLRALCATLHSREGARTRLDHLTRGYACTLLLHNEFEANKRVLQIDTKACTEECLGALLQRKDVVSMNLREELKFVQLAQQALDAFRLFYERADAEPISSLETHIDWEFVLDDVETVAQLLELYGYVESATLGWLLLYRIANTIMHTDKALRALAYFCENADYFDENGESDVDGGHLSLPTAIAALQPPLLRALQQVSTLTLNQQSDMLSCVCHLAYYYARAGNFVYAELLLMLVQQQHELLPDRLGKFDVVLATVRIVSFRILWKQLSVPGRLHSQQTSSLPLLQGFLLRHIDSAIDNFRDISYVTSSDSMRYMNLLLTVIEQFGECAANRLSDPLLNGIFASTLKMAIQMRGALRTIQILTIWVYGNLQREEMQKAQVKLLLIECFMGVRDLAQLTKSTRGVGAPTTVKKPIKSRKPLDVDGGDALSLHVLAGVETMRKALSNGQPSPLDMTKIRPSPTARTRGLLSFLRRHNTLQPEAQLQWTYTIVGCMNARLLYLVRDYEQLADFYVAVSRWWRDQPNSLLRRHYRNMQLLSEHHYVNYLRASGQLEAALDRLDELMALCMTQRHNSVDCIYWVNFLQQRNDTKLQQQQLQDESARQTPALSRLALSRRALEFVDDSPPKPNTIEMTPPVGEGPASSDTLIDDGDGDGDTATGEDDLNACIVDIDLDDSSIICLDDDRHDKQHAKKNQRAEQTELNDAVQALQALTITKAATKTPARTARKAKRTEKDGVENSATPLNQIVKKTQLKSVKSRKNRINSNETIDLRVEKPSPPAAADVFIDRIDDGAAADEPVEPPSTARNAKKPANRTTRRAVNSAKDAVVTESKPLGAATRRRAQRK